MKIAKLTFYIMVVALILAFCSCGFFGDQKYYCDIETVETIQIVQLYKYIDGEYSYEYTVVSEISDRDTFVERLNGLNHSVNFGEPSQLDEGYFVIRIEYNNGDYDLLYSNAQWFNRSGVNQNGYFFFDEEQFNLLISDYLR